MKIGDSIIVFDIHSKLNLNIGTIKRQQGNLYIIEFTEGKYFIAELPFDSEHIKLINPITELLYKVSK